MKGHQKQRLCDYCNESTAVLYCRPDSAKLCLFCDREVHSTNQLFSKHTRSQLCDACDQSPASIFCETEQLALCPNCDWQNHNHNNLSVSSVHNRRTIEGFTGCPSVCELMAVTGFDELGSDKKKTLFLDEEESDDLLDVFAWESPGFVSLDDLIVATDSNHNYQAMDVPPLPKNRNATCGQHKEEMLHQLRDLAKLEPDLKYQSVAINPISGFQSLADEQNPLTENLLKQCENDAKPFPLMTHEANALHWFNDSGEAANQDFHSSTELKGCEGGNSVVPDEQLNNGLDVSHILIGEPDQSPHPVTPRIVPTFTKNTHHELKREDRGSAISRYKEKRKTRRYDGHIRYESRKQRAEGRTRIKGRFAKADR